MKTSLSGRCRIALMVLAAMAVASPVAAEESQQHKDASTTTAAATTSDEAQLAPDRPGFSTGTSVVTPNRMQLEFGADVSLHDGSNVAQSSDLLLRYGLTDFAELRLGTTPIGVSSVSGDEAQMSYLSSTTLGAKLATSVGEDVELGIMPYVAMGDVTGSPTYSGGALAIVELSDEGPVGISANFGVTSVPDGGERGLEWVGSVAADATMTETLGSFVELYTIAAPGSRTAVYTEGGVTYELSRQLHLDGFLGLQISSLEEVFGGLGVSVLM